jgi:hypothetical protein
LTLGIGILLAGNAMAAEVIYVSQDTPFVVINKGYKFGYDVGKKACFYSKSGALGICANVDKALGEMSAFKIDPDDLEKISVGDFAAPEGWTVDYMGNQAGTDSMASMYGRSSATRISLLGMVAPSPIVRFNKTIFKPVPNGETTRSGNWTSSGEDDSAVDAFGGSIALQLSNGLWADFGARSEGTLNTQVVSPYAESGQDFQARTTLSYRAVGFWTDILYEASHLSWLSSFIGGGIDLAKTSLNFVSTRRGEAEGSTVILGQARSELYVASLRVQLAAILSVAGIEVALGSHLLLPVYSFGKEFEGESTQINGVTVTEDNLEKQMGHDKSAYGMYLFMSLGMRY